MSEQEFEKGKPAPIWACAPILRPDLDRPPYGYVPEGALPHPRHARTPHVPTLPDPRDGAGAEVCLAYGVDLYHAGYLWEAHEVWEAPWQVARGLNAYDAAFWQGLIWNAAAQLKLRSGRIRGARRLSEKAHAALVSVHRFAGVDAAGYYRELNVARLVEEIHRHYAPLWETDSSTVCGSPPRLYMSLNPPNALER